MIAVACKFADSACNAMRRITDNFVKTAQKAVKDLLQAAGSY
jgi:hypothetical protein